jgi:hypothetical protein
MLVCVKYISGRNRDRKLKDMSGCHCNSYVRQLALQARSNEVATK